VSGDSPGCIFSDTGCGKSRDWTVVLAGEHTTEHLSILLSTWVQIL
jgi:hypothetical protein